MMRCPSCSRQNDDDARFCAHCGAPLAHAPSREERNAKKVHGFVLETSGHFSTIDVPGANETNGVIVIPLPAVE